MELVSTHHSPIPLSSFSLHYNVFTGCIFLHFRKKILTPDEVAKMPSCNLAETVHNKWLQASGNKGDDLYIAAMDDYV